MPSPAARWKVAQIEYAQFDQDFKSGGMSAVASDISGCYATAPQSKIPESQTRLCLVYDAFATRFAYRIQQGNPNLPVPPFFESRTAAARLASHGPAGKFPSPQYMRDFLDQFVAAVFAVMAQRHPVRSG